ncbi:MAG: YhgE/Pip domain-containing protein [Clostridiales bacterium]|nr:YhgE/Pip domain-containing protein [Clostridiales bacterium]
MKNIFRIFAGDLRHIRGNVIALIVVLGICVVPSLYAWFNIAASWDPYSSTGALKVAVANTDSGYTGALLPVELNLGDQVVSNLQGNDQLDWIFTTEQEAVEGVRSGSYYAAIVIPPSFSRDMMSLFSDTVTHSEILYYLNEKENAIAPKVTDKGASAIVQQVDQVFTQTVSQIGLELLQALDDGLSEADLQSISENLKGNLRQIASDLEAAAGTTESFSNLLGALDQMLQTTADFLTQSGARLEEDRTVLQDTQQTVDQLQTALAATGDSAQQALDLGDEYYQSVSRRIDAAFTSLSDDASDTAKGLSALAEEVQVRIDRYTDLRESLEDLAQTVSALQRPLQPVLTAVDSAISRQTALRDGLKQAGQDLRGAANGLEDDQAYLMELVQQNIDQLAQLRQDYEAGVKEQLQAMADSLDGANGALSSVLDQLSQSLMQADGSADQTASRLASLQRTLDGSTALLRQSAQSIRQTLDQLEQPQGDGELETLQTVLDGGVSAVSAFLAAPVQMQTHRLYAVENYGAAMTPFYSTLAIWVGGVVLVAMIKVPVSAQMQAQLKRPKLHQLYLGRYLLFLLLGLIQSTLICLGDLYFLEVQCLHPFLFLLAGWVSSIVYVNLIYTLTVSFGDIGKAVCVLLMVMQVAGSGGTFPIEMLPDFFQQIYPFLPFTHSMAAMRECIGGLYETAYWSELAALGLFLGASLLLGLVLRRPVIRLNERFTERLERTKLM